MLAEGEAKAIRRIGEKIGGNTAYLELQRIKMATEVAKILGRSRNRIFLQSDTLLLNLHEPLKHISANSMRGDANPAAQQAPPVAQAPSVDAEKTQ